MDIKRPLPRPIREAILDPSIDDLANLAVVRMHHIAQPDSQNLPPTLFPLAEKLRWDFFTHRDWDEYGDLETEYARLTYTLNSYPERGPPAICEKALTNLLSQPSILAAWPAIVPFLRAQAAAVVDKVVRAMRGNLTQREYLSKSDIVTVPVDYNGSESARELSLQLWKRSLDEMATKLATGQVGPEALQFLQIHAYLKDPIYGFSKPLKVQQFYFKVILERFWSVVRAESLGQSVLVRLTAQAAQESSYMANPLLDKLVLVHFQAHNQLTYVNVSIDSLARAEFGVPLHVLEVAEEMLSAVAANNGQACPIVPILVTTRPTYSNNDRYLVPIIDGNHRVTATLLLRFLGSQISIDNNLETVSQLLTQYCEAHHLGKKWQIDLIDVLKELFNPANSHYYNHLRTDMILVRKFATVTSIPALLVQEEDFHTICKQRSAGKSDLVLLHPFHQTLFNDDDLPFALPQKAGQTHGRPESFRLLPLVPFGAEYHGVGGSKVFAANLRQSMGGLTQEGVMVSGESNGYKFVTQELRGSLATES